MDTQTERNIRFLEVMGRSGFIINGVCYHYCNGKYNRLLDIAQEVRLGLWADFDSLPADSSLFEERLWVFRVARRVAWGYVRRKRPEVTVADFERFEASLVTDPRIDSRIDLLVECLDKAEADMLDLMRRGYGIDEIAVKMNIGYEAARSRRRRMIEKMRRYAAKNNML